MLWSARAGRLGPTKIWAMSTPALDSNSVAATPHAGMPVTSPSREVGRVATVRRGTALLGDYGERLAARYLRDQGFQIVSTKWRCRYGEIDLVAVDRGVLVVCEVKTGRTEVFGHPRDAITAVKLARLRRLAAEWLYQQSGSFDEVRIDIVSVLRPAAGPALVEHLRGVG